MLGSWARSEFLRKRFSRHSPHWQESFHLLFLLSARMKVYVSTEGAKKSNAPTPCHHARDIKLPIYLSTSLQLPALSYMSLISAHCIEVSSMLSHIHSNTKSLSHHLNVPSLQHIL